MTHKITQWGEDLYITPLDNKLQIELQVHDTSICVDIESITELIKLLKKLENG